MFKSELDATMEQINALIDAIEFRLKRPDPMTDEDIRIVMKAIRSIAEMSKRFGKTERMVDELEEDMEALK